MPQASCPKCGTRVNMPDSVEALRVRCPGCRRFFEASAYSPLEMQAPAGSQRVLTPQEEGLSANGRTAIIVTAATLGGVLFVALMVYLTMRPSANTDSPDDSATAVLRPPPSPPAPLPKPQPPATPAATRTKITWDRMNEIDASLSLLSPENISGEYWGENSRRYAQINTDYVDEELKSYVRGWSETCREFYQMLKEVTRELKVIERSVAQAGELGSQVGSLNESNPRGGAVAGRVVFRLLAQKGAQEQVKALQAKYKDRAAALRSNLRSLYRNRKGLGPILSKRYGVPFEVRTIGHLE